VEFGRNRESRTREDAGRRNWPEAVPRKMRGRKRLSQNRYHSWKIHGQLNRRAKKFAVLADTLTSRRDFAS
jgi:hypothetical protein